MVFSADVAFKLISLAEQCKLEEVKKEVEDREGFFYRGVVLFDPAAAMTQLYGLRTAEARCGVYLLIDRSDVGLGRIHHEAGAILGSEGEITFSGFSGDQERRSQNRGSPVSDNEPRVTRQYFKVNGALEYRATVWKRKIRAPRAVIMALRRKESRRSRRHHRDRPASAPPGAAAAGSAAAGDRLQDCGSGLSDDDLDFMSADELYAMADELPDGPGCRAAALAGEAIDAGTATADHAAHPAVEKIPITFRVPWAGADRPVLGEKRKAT